MRNAIFSLLLISAFGCSVSRQKSVEALDDIRVKELRYGICQTGESTTEQMENSPSGTRSFSEDFKLIKQTDRIPGKIGQKFGVEFIIKSDMVQVLTIEQVWIFPSPITDEKGKVFNEIRYKVAKTTNEPTYSFYTLEKEFEVVKGEWIYQMFLDGEKIYEKKFYIE